MVAKISDTWELFPQSSFTASRFPELSRNSRTGSASAPLIAFMPVPRDGPRARIMTRFEPPPYAIIPAIMGSLAVPMRPRVEMLTRRVVLESISYASTRPLPVPPP